MKGLFVGLGMFALSVAIAWVAATVAVWGGRGVYAAMPPWLAALHGVSFVAGAGVTITVGIFGSVAALMTGLEIEGRL